VKNPEANSSPEAGFPECKPEYPAGMGHAEFPRLDNQVEARQVVLWENRDLASFLQEPLDASVWQPTLEG
jgi:hypothetical protein